MVAALMGLGDDRELSNGELKILGNTLDGEVAASLSGPYLVVLKHGLDNREVTLIGQCKNLQCLDRIQALGHLQVVLCVLEEALYRPWCWLYSL